MISISSYLFRFLQRVEKDSLSYAYITVLTFGKMSVLLVLCLALDRWFAVVQPIRYRYNFTTRRVFLYVAVIAAVAVSCNIPSALSLGESIEMYFEITEVIVMVLIPILLTWIIFIHIWVHSKTSPAMHNAAGGKLKSKLLRMCAVTAVFLTISWLPLQINRLITLIQTDRRTSTPLQMIAMTNSCVNPWVYYFTNQEYKNAFQKLLPCIGIKFTSKPSGNIWGQRITGSVAVDCEKGAVSILGMRNLKQFAIPD